MAMKRNLNTVKLVPSTHINTNSSLQLLRNRTTLIRRHNVHLCEIQILDIIYYILVGKIGFKLQTNGTLLHPIAKY